MNTIVKRAIFGGAVSTLVMVSGTFILGHISGYKALELLQNSKEEENDAGDLEPGEQGWKPYQ